MSNLKRLIQQRILDAGGQISFAEFMQMALYTPELGYYVSKNETIGAGGDFVTAPEISALFAQCVARQYLSLNPLLKQNNFLEIGAGTGKFAADFLTFLITQDALPPTYFIVEISPRLRQKQRAAIVAVDPVLLDRIQWLDDMPTNFTGMIFANEVVDAMPAHCFEKTADGLYERCVTVKENEFAWCLAKPSDPLLKLRLAEVEQSESLPVNYQSECRLQIQAWMASLSNALSAGLILIMDYGLGERDYYHPDRSQGSLMCFHDQKRSDNPLIKVGEQDISVQVDFTQLAECAVAADLEVAAYTTQAGFVLEKGLLETNTEGWSEAQKYKLNQEIKQLTMPSQMGELVKALILTRSIGEIGRLSLHDRRHDL